LRRQAHIPELVNHVALGVPVLVVSVSHNLDKLLEDGGSASGAPLGKLRRVVEMAKDLTFVLIVAILGAKLRRADRAGKVVDVVLALKSRNVRSAQCATTFVA